MPTKVVGSQKVNQIDFQNYAGTMQLPPSSDWRMKVKPDGNFYIQRGDGTGNFFDMFSVCTEDGMIIDGDELEQDEPVENIILNTDTIVQKKIRLGHYSTPPSTAEDGSLIYNTSTKTIQYKSENKWNDVANKDEIPLTLTDENALKVNTNLMNTASAGMPYLFYNTDKNEIFYDSNHVQLKDIIEELSAELDELKGRVSQLESNSFK